MAPSANLLFSSTCRHSSSWFSCLKSLGGMSLNLFRFIRLLSLDHRHHHSLPPPPCTTLQWIWTLYSCASPQNTRVNQRNATVNHDLIVRLMCWSMATGRPAAARLVGETMEYGNNSRGCQQNRDSTQIIIDSRQSRVCGLHICLCTDQTIRTGQRVEEHKL